jgi:hypothetical protein
VFASPTTASCTSNYPADFDEYNTCIRGEELSLLLCGETGAKAMNSSIFYAVNIINFLCYTTPALQPILRFSRAAYTYWGKEVLY